MHASPMPFEVCVRLADYWVQSRILHYRQRAYESEALESREATCPKISTSTSTIPSSVPYLQKSSSQDKHFSSLSPISVSLVSPSGRGLGYGKLEGD